MVKPAVVFRSETWAVPEMDMKRLGTGEREILRIHGPVVERGKCRIRTEQELRELPYFSIDNAHLMYNAHPKLFRHSF